MEVNEVQIVDLA
jgi:ethanolaminephosphotransferase